MVDVAAEFSLPGGGSDVPGRDFRLGPLVGQSELYSRCCMQGGRIEDWH